MTTMFNTKFATAMLRDARIFRQNNRAAILLDEEAFPSWINRIFVTALTEMDENNPLILELAAMNDYLQIRRTNEMEASRLETVRHEAMRAQAALGIVIKSIGTIAENLNTLPLARKLDSAQNFAEAIYQTLRLIGNSVTKDDVISEEEYENE